MTKGILFIIYAIIFAIIAIICWLAFAGKFGSNMQKKGMAAVFGTLFTILALGALAYPK